jgi:hypothetical protein
MEDLVRRQTRFERVLQKGSFIDKLKKTEKKVDQTANESVKAAIPAKPTSNVLAGKQQAHDGAMSIEMLLSNMDGEYTPSFTGPVPGQQYYIRCKVAQHQGDPQLQGFLLRWKKPAGWRWIDGLNVLTIDEAVSNPLVVTRVAICDTTASRQVFKTTIEEVFKI